MISVPFNYVPEGEIYGGKAGEQVAWPAKPRRASNGHCGFYQFNRQINCTVRPVLPSVTR